MNRIAQQLKEKNIAEYLIYMWQEEDLIRAYDCELDGLAANIIARYPEEQRAEMTEWYRNLITMMREEGVRDKGHLQINKNVVINLTDLHKDRKSTRLNSSHANISYAVFCLKKKKKQLY